MSRPLGRPRGFSLPEVLISLAISAMLLTAIAAAYSASSSAVEVNDRLFRAAQAGRVAMNQLLAAVRRSQACQVGETYDGSASTVTANVLKLITHDDQDRSFKHLSAEMKLKLLTNDNPTDPDYTLASNVSALSFTADLEPDPRTHVMRVVRVTVQMTITVSDAEITLSGSAVPRRALVY